MCRSGVGGGKKRRRLFIPPVIYSAGVSVRGGGGIQKYIPPPHLDVNQTPVSGSELRRGSGMWRAAGETVDKPESHFSVTLDLICGGFQH